VPPAFAGFAFFDSQAILVSYYYTLDPVTLRRQLSLVLLFSCASLLLHEVYPNSIDWRGFKMIVRSYLEQEKITTWRSAT
jgi:hypothetical protein